MSGRMRTRTIGESTDIIVSVPNDIADQIKALIQGMLDLAERPKNEVNIDEDKLYSAKEVMGDITPGRALRGLRVREDMTQKEFAEKLGISQRRVSELENGIRPISAKMALKIEEVFGDPYEIFLN